MPFEQGVHVPMYPYQALLVTATGVSLQAVFYDDGQQAPGYLDDMLLSLVDHLQAWEYRWAPSNVEGQKYDTTFIKATPTNPIPIEPPAEDPDDPGGGTGEPTP